jgi:arylsulfatase A-like enzyme
MPALLVSGSSISRQPVQRLLAPLFLALALFALPLQPASPAQRDSRPNIVVLMTDDQHVGSLSKMALTQQLIADQGTTFTNSFVSTPLCCPSRVTFLTGQYMHNHGVLSNSAPDGGYWKLDHTNTLAVWLQNAGYSTGFVGKYLNDYPFNRADEIPPGYDFWVALASDWQYFNYTLNENGVLNVYPEDPQGENYLTDVLARRATSFIASRASDPAPFFLWVAFLAPHTQLDLGLMGPTPAPRHAGAFAGEPLPQPPSFNEADVSDKPSFIQSLPSLDQATIADLTTHHQKRLESLLAVDEAVSAIVDALAAAGKLDNTFLIFTSDNGYFHGEHRIVAGKSYQYEEALRVPLLIRGPGVPHQTLGHLVVNVDLAPTIVQIAMASSGRRMDGLSLLPLLQNPSLPWRRSFLIEGPQYRYLGVRTTSQVYLYHLTTHETEFYDLNVDPYQLESRPRPARPAEAGALQQRLEQLRRCAGLACR